MRRPRAVGRIEDRHEAPAVQLSTFHDPDCTSWMLPRRWTGKDGRRPGAVELEPAAPVRQ